MAKLLSIYHIFYSLYVDDLFHILLSFWQTLDPWNVCM